jgi:hypothetical protein
MSEGEVKKKPIAPGDKPKRKKREKKVPPPPPPLPPPEAGDQ